MILLSELLEPGVDMRNVSAEHTTGVPRGSVEADAAQGKMGGSLPHVGRYILYCVHRLTGSRYIVKFPISLSLEEGSWAPGSYYQVPGAHREPIS